MKGFTTIMVAVILFMPGFSGGIYADETSPDKSVVEEQTLADEKPSEEKKETEEEPECD